MAVPRVVDEGFEKNVALAKASVEQALPVVREHHVKSLNFRGEAWSLGGKDGKLSDAEAGKLVAALRRDIDLDYDSIAEALGRIPVALTGDATHVTQAERDLLMSALKAQAGSFRQGRKPSGGG